VSQHRGLVIVGGGAAGIGAALEAKAKGVDALILEAGNRLGGRGHSIAWKGYNLDLGCTWLHSADHNSLRAEAERLGRTVNRGATHWFSQYRDLGFTPAEQAEAGAAYEQLESCMAEVPPPSDRASDAIDADNPWKPWLDSISGYLNGAPLDEVSVADWLAYDDAASMHNWRLPGGYGALISALGADCDHRLATRVTAISRARDAVQVSTTEGMLSCDKAIVTVPTSVLNRIRFDPPLEGLFEAAEALPLGLADKLFLELDGAEEFPHSAHLAGNPFSAETGSYTLHPMGMPVIEAFYGGLGARALEKLTDEDAAAFAIDELTALLGSGIRKRLRFVTRSCWGQEPLALGSYSHAQPGKADMRARLAEAGDARIRFAGEATSPTAYSTAHGAFDSGKAAVRRLYG
jgi:monoamine oxidase